MSSQNFKVRNGLNINNLQVIDAAANGYFNVVTANSLILSGEGALGTDQFARDTANSAGLYANTGITLAQAAFDQANTGGGGGSSANVGLYVTNDTFTANGLTDSFTLSVTPINEESTIINFDGITQQKSQYSLSGNTITFTETPNTGTLIEIVSFVNAGNGIFIVSDVGFVDNIARSIANSAGIYANTGINNAASASLYANTGITLAQAAFNQANTGGGGGGVDQFARDSSNSASLYANTGITLAQSAFDQANTVYLPSVTRLNVTNAGAGAFLFDQYTGNNPTLYITAGETIAFNLNVTGHPFMIRETSGGTNYNTGLTHVSTTGTVLTEASAQGQVTGTLYWKVPAELASNNYVYQCSVHAGMVGTICIGEPSAIISTQTNAAFNQANSANVLAQAAFNQANTGITLAQAAFNQANTGGGGGGGASTITTTLPGITNSPYTGTARRYFLSNTNIQFIGASNSTLPSANIVIDILKNGTSAANITIPSGTYVTSLIPYSINISAGDYLTINIVSGTSTDLMIFLQQ